MNFSEPVEPDDVVITGFGAITPLGHDVESVYRSLLSGHSPVRTLIPESGLDGSYWMGGAILGFDAKEHVQPRKTIKVMCREIQLGFGASMQACRMAGVASGSMDPDRLGTVFSGEIIFSETVDVESIVRLCASEGQMEHGRWAAEAIENMYPLWMLKSLPNMAACHVGIALDARGPNNTITTASTSSLNAMLEAINVIRRDKADVMVVGATASQNTYTRLLQRYEADYSRAYADPASACKPFDRERDGCVSGESASALVLERRSHAVARNANILGSISAWANTFNPSLDGRWSGTKLATERALGMLLARSGLQAAEIDHVNAHANGTIPGDAGEAMGIKSVLGNVPVVSYKGAFGDSISAAGLVESIASLVGMRAGSIAPTTNHHTTAADCPIQVISGSAKPRNRSHVIKLSQSFQGHCIGVVLCVGN